MWTTISDVLTSDNGFLVSFLFLLLVVLIIICARLGIVKIKTDKLTVGADAGETERTIVRNQIEWCTLATAAFESKIPRHENYDKYRGKYICEQVLDEVVKWIAFNHIENKRAYIGIKQEIIWNIVQSHVVRDEMRTDEFRKYVDEYVEYVIENLVAIRNEYKK